MFIQIQHIFCADGMWTGIQLWFVVAKVWLLYMHNTRAWQKKLYSLVQDPDSRTNLYQYLCLLISCSDPAKFREDLQDLLCVWRDREPKFIEYFQAAYANRAGKYNQYATFPVFKYHIQRSGHSAIVILTIMA